MKNLPSRAQRSRQRREDILEAALQGCAEGGEDSVTIKQVGARSGASVGSLYHHFGSKDQIWRPSTAIPWTITDRP